MNAPTREPRVALIAGEHSGDQLGFKLMRALRAQTGGGIEFSGVGGEAMEAEGLESLFPMSDIAVMGVLPVVAKLPTLLARIRQTAEAVVAGRPDALVVIDSPDFTHRVARRVRRALPGLPVIDYVSPSVWAWRPGRARAMRAYVDCVLALLPFEPAAHARLGGPRCVYVGHPLIERLSELRPNADEARRRACEPPLVAVLPGSRRSVIARMMDDFGGALALLARDHGPFEIVLPTLPHVESEVRARAQKWAVKPRIEVGEAAKLAVFRAAHVALAASGTVTLELALAGVPTVGAYKVSRLEEQLKYFIKLPEFDPAAEPHPGRARDSGNSATRMHAGPSGRRARRPHARGARPTAATRRARKAGRADAPARRRGPERARGSRNARDDAGARGAKGLAFAPTKTVSAVAHRLIFAARGAGVELARATDLLVGIFDHFLPLGDPADGSRHREQHREHGGRETHRLERDARIEVDVRIELLLDEIIVVQRDALQLHRDVEQRIVLDADFGEHVVRGPLHDLGARDRNSCRRDGRNP